MSHNSRDKTQQPPRYEGKLEFYKNKGCNFTLIIKIIIRFSYKINVVDYVIMVFNV